MMQETQPLLLLRKYRSILVAALAVEVVSFAVSLTDSIVAANFVGQEAFAAIGLMSPFFSIATFVTAVFNSGTCSNYNYEIGCSDHDRACEYFSQGVIMAVASGVLLTVLLILGRNPVIVFLGVPDSKLTYLNEYYDIIVFYFMMAPISALLDNMVVSDGGERLSAVSNIIQIIGNIMLSVILAQAFGVRGIAAASVICKALFIILICLWFVGKKNTIRFRWHFTKADVVKIISRGIVRATTFVMSAIMTFVLNAFILKFYPDDVFNVWVVMQKILGLSSVFIGLSMTMQSMISQLRGENNTKSIRALARRAYLYVIAFSLILTAAILLLTVQTLRVFGITDGAELDMGIPALRIGSLMLPFLATAVFFFIYYWLIDKPALTILVSVLNDLICPLGLVVLLYTIMGKSPNGVWWGLTLASPLALLFVVIVVYVRYGKEQVPLLIPIELDNWIRIYAFKITDEHIMRLSLEVQNVLKDEGYSEHTQHIAALCIEDPMMLIKEKNEESGKDIYAECSLVMEENGVRIVIRDTGVIFDLTDEDAEVDSFLQFTVAGIITTTDVKTYVVSVGFNRNEFYIEDKAY